MEASPKEDHSVGFGVQQLPTPRETKNVSSPIAIRLAQHWSSAAEAREATLLHLDTSRRARLWMAQ